MTRPGVAAALQQTDQEEHLLLALGAEAEVLVVLHALLGVEVDVEELAVPHRLGDAMVEVEVRHLLVPDLGVEPDHLGVLELVDEGERVADGRQEDVAARLVRLRLEREPDVVALRPHVLAEDVEALLVAVESDADVLGAVGVGAFPSTPAHVGRCTQFGGDVDVVHHLADRVAPHLTVVRRESAIAKHGMEEEVRGGHRADHARLVQRLLEPGDATRAIGVALARGEQVVVVVRHAPHAELAHLLHEVDRVGPWPRLVAERIATDVADRPHAEGELVFRTRFVRACHVLPPVSTIGSQV